MGSESRVFQDNLEIMCLLGLGRHIGIPADLLAAST